MLPHELCSAGSANMRAIACDEDGTGLRPETFKRGYLCAGALHLCRLVSFAAVLHASSV